MAVRAGKADGLDYVPMQPVRAPSFSSDIMSASSKSAGAAYSVPDANPPPAYVAQMEASKILTREMDRRVVVSQPALALLNEFLDHVLYNIILTSQSVALFQIRAAVPAVLKPRLGKLALKAGEEELREYMDEDQVQEELYSSRYSVIAKSGFDPELVWKLARLRCMVYTRMGDVEEEDEEEWLDKERLLDQVAASPSEARHAMAVSPNVAIFLAAILEHLGEQALYYAAQYAQKRHDNAQTQTLINSDPASQMAARDADIILDGKDMNHVGRDSPLSRLWRSWRRNTRSPAEPKSRSISPESTMNPLTDAEHGRGTSNGYYPVPPIVEETGASGERSSVLLTPSQIPLPETENDIAEIEGLEPLTEELALRRHRSMPSMPGEFPTENDVNTDPPPFLERSPRRPVYVRVRSRSVPASKRPFETDPLQEQDDFPLPIQRHTEEETLPSTDDTADDVVSPVVDEEVDSVPSPPPPTRDGRPKPVRTPTPEELNTTVGVLAGALGAVGVHHVGRKALQIKANEPYMNNNMPVDQPLTSASIKGPDDFDLIYTPEAQFPAAQQPGPVRSKPSPIITNAKDPYHEIRLQQYEEHKRYSQQSHTMDTPSIYSHREHSPRFPTDMRRNSTAAEEAERASEIIATSYAPTPEPGFQPAVHGSIYGPQSVHVDSPVSAVSSKFSRNQLPASPEPIPEVPNIPEAHQNDEDRANRRHSKSSSSSSRLLGFTRDSAGRPYTIHQQKAAGDMSEEVRRAHSSTPNGSGVARPGTADSQPSPKRQHLRIREDSENNVMRSSGANDRPKRSLEDMIKSDETLHYTLTPATAAYQAQDVATPAKRPQTQDLAEFFRTTAPPGSEDAAPKNITRSRKVSLEAGRAPQAISGQRARNVIPSSQNVSQIAGAAKPKNPIGEPRDAKVDSMGGVRDLADYVRSTGPSTDDQLPKPLSIRDLATSPTKIRAPLVTAPAPTSPKSTRKSSNRLQARDPRPSRSAESSALIDFIREGPPREAGDHRINRNVAPFRTTMDSDDLNGLVSQFPRASKNSSEMTGVPSIATTNNSNTPLINHSAKVATSSAPTRAVAAPDSEDGMPKKTRRRVKDPYAIDDSDDEDFLETTTPKQTNEESLIDFLRNTAPPSNMVAQPLLSSPEQAQKALMNNKSTLNRTPSLDKIRDLVRGGRSTPAPPANPPSYSQSFSSSPAQAQSRARAESPHLTQAGSKLDTYRPTQVTHAAHVERERNRRVQTQSRADSRLSTRTENTVGYGATADLADYLRNTGPPPAFEQEVQPFILTNSPVNGVKKEEGGLKKFFSMRGKK